MSNLLLRNNSILGHLLSALPAARQQDSFQGITTEDDSWFLYADQSDHMYEASRSEVVPQERHTTRAKKIMLTVFFSGERRLSLETLPKGTKFNQDYFLQSVLPALTNEKGQHCRKNRGADVFVHMDNT
jgi:hypothetical protein